MRQPKFFTFVLATIIACSLAYAAFTAAALWNEPRDLYGWLFWSVVLLALGGLFSAFVAGVAMMVGGVLWGAAWLENTRAATRVMMAGLILTLASVVAAVVGWAVLSS